MIFVRILLKKSPTKLLDFSLYTININYTNPCSNIASATFTNPAMLAPLT